MAKIDSILLWLFSGVIVMGIAWTFVSLRKAMRAANADDEGLRMFFWAVSALIGIIVAGVSAAYILLPIIFHYAE